MKFRTSRAFIATSLLAAAAGADAQTYTYLPEGFEEEAWLASKPATVVSATGKWTSFKNSSSAEKAFSGARSLYFSEKGGLQSPLLERGAGAVVYYVDDSNRQVILESTRDGETWTEHESYKLTAPWTRHAVEINDPEARYIRLRSTSNGNVYIDDLLITLPDGTDGDGNQIVCPLRLPYFTHDFEDQSTYPKTKPETETAIEVAGQGEWKFLLAYRNTNASYIPDGSSAGLRLLKNGGYVITPLLGQGVVKVEFDEGRGGRKLKVYTSRDGGATWDAAGDITTETHNTLTINDRLANRVKIANESTSDADIDNLTVTAFPSGLPATLGDCLASETGPSGALLTSSIIDGGDHPLISCGFCWAIGHTPTLSDATAEATAEGPSFSARLTGLPSSTEITACPYVLTLAGAAYGKEITFRTAETALPTVETLSVEIDSLRSDEERHVLRIAISLPDLGGGTLKEIGAAAALHPAPTTDDVTTTARPEADGTYTAYLEADPSTDYYIRAYATTEAGTAYGRETVFTTPEIVIPSYPHRVYFCSPDGDDATADGSAGAPFRSLQKAADLVEAGDTIYMLAGKYEYTERVNLSTIGAKGSGMIALHSLGGRATLDFAGQQVASANQGVRLTGSYWHFYGIDIVNAGDNGLLIERNKPSGGGYADIAAATEQAHDNVIENCAFIRNADTGLQMKNLASHNKVINCDAYYNTDPDHGDADGFAVKISHGDGNYFYGCRAWQNSDDGWDQFIKKEGGFPDDITTTLESCWAFRNGILESGEKSRGNGNGFKLGSDQGRNNVILNRCLAFENVNKGFDQNHNTGHMILNNCTGYSSKDTSSKSRYTYRLDEPTATGRIIRLTNCVAVSDGIADRNKSAYAPWAVSGEVLSSEMTALPEDFESIDWTAATAPRKEDGSLPDIPFMHISPSAARLIDTGSRVAPFDGESHWAEGILWAGEAPDLGCFERGMHFSTSVAEVEAAPQGRLELWRSRSGLCTVTIPAAGCLGEKVLTLADTSGKILLRRAFTGASTSFMPPAGCGVVIVSVSSPTWSASAKMSEN